ncbi:hypothetical protein GX50_05822 [[Emmonsia] crescens]|uniref:Uncharacterized protein n=1 Tax=[Emmonsia] crescens TaxID=73230 RepID=A0A2B7Z4W0_9EURO|nr:hypothetical protein GX50_05822 [Emmonsia crescens]
MGQNSQTANSCNRFRRQLLKQLPPGTSEYRFEGMQHMARMVDIHLNRISEDQDGSDNKEKKKSLAPGEFVFFFSVPAEILESQLSKYDIIAKSFSSYYKPQQILLLKMLSAPHERIGRKFEYMLLKAADQMGIENELITEGSTTVRGSQRDKEPDSQYRPSILPAGRSDVWPTVVVEVGNSESQRQLDSDAKWWLEDSNGDVQLVITMSVNDGKGIIIRSWEADARPTRTNPDRIICQIAQEVKMLRHPDQSTEILGNVPFILPFEKVMLRLPSQPQEGDIIFPAERLRDLATRVWGSK